MRSSRDERLFFKYVFAFSASVYMTATFSNLNRLDLRRRSASTSSIIVMHLLVKKELLFNLAIALFNLLN